MKALRFPSINMHFKKVGCIELLSITVFPLLPPQLFSDAGRLLPFDHSYPGTEMFSVDVGYRKRNGKATLSSSLGKTLGFDVFEILNKCTNNVLNLNIAFFCENLNESLK